MKETNNGFVRITLLETKGQHLAGNVDAEYKRRVFDLLSEHSERVKIDAGQLQLFKNSGHKLNFKLLLQDTWRTEIQDALNQSGRRL